MPRNKVQIVFVLLPEDRLALQRLAKQQGESVGVILRQLIRLEIRRQHEDGNMVGSKNFTC